MAIDKETIRRRVRTINEILNREWDPIGVTAIKGWSDDEYSTYAGKLSAMIGANAADSEMIEYLEWVESVHMAFGRSNRKRAESVVASIRRQLKGAD